MPDTSHSVRYEDAVLAKVVGALQGLAEGNPKWEAILTKHEIPVNEATHALHSILAERERLVEQLESTQKALREFHEEMWTVQDGDGPQYVSSEGLKYMRGWFDRTRHLLGEASSPANGDAETSGTSGRPAPSPARVSERDTGSRAEEPGEPPHPDSADASRSETPASSPASRPEAS